MTLLNIHWGPSLYIYIAKLPFSFSLLGTGLLNIAVHAKTFISVTGVYQGCISNICRTWKKYTCPELNPRNFLNIDL